MSYFEAPDQFDFDPPADEELSPCPFCGCDVYKVLGTDKMAHSMTGDCALSGFQTTRTAWNQRATNLVEVKLRG